MTPDPRALPVIRQRDCMRGAAYCTLHGMITMKSGEAPQQLPPAIYVHTDDPRTDDELRALFSGEGR
jgi:hypothetical protein